MDFFATMKFWWSIFQVRYHFFLSCEKGEHCFFNVWNSSECTTTHFYFTSLWGLPYFEVLNAQTLKSSILFVPGNKQSSSSPPFHISLDFHIITLIFFFVIHLCIIIGSIHDKWWQISLKKLLCYFVSPCTAGPAGTHPADGGWHCRAGHGVDQTSALVHRLCQTNVGVHHYQTADLWKVRDWRAYSGPHRYLYNIQETYVRLTRRSWIYSHFTKIKKQYY